MVTTRLPCSGIKTGTAAKPGLASCGVGVAIATRQRAIIQPATICSSSAGYRASTYAPLATTIELPADDKPRLVNRQISVNPLDTASALVAKAFSKLDLLVATTVDTAAWMTWAAALAVGISAALGLCWFQQLNSGQPDWLHNTLEDRLGPTLLLGLAKLVPVLAAAFPALWHLRTWWAGSIEAFRHLLPNTTVPTASASIPVAVSSVCTLAVLFRLVTMTAAVSSAAAYGWLAPLSALLTAALSLAPFAAVAAATPRQTSVTTPARGEAGSGNAASSQKPSQTKATPIVVAATPAGFPAAAPLLLPVLASDAAAVAAALLWAYGVPPSLWSAAAAGAALAASLATIASQPRFAQRLAPIRAALKDRATVHITIKTDFGSQLDTSVGKRPLQIVVGSAIDEFAARRLGSEAAKEVQAVSAQDTYLDVEVQAVRAEGARTSTSGQDQSQGMAEALTAEASASTTGAPAWSVDPLSPEMAVGTLRFCTPAFGLLLDALLPGMLVGEKASVQVHNPPPDAGGFINPELVWWQPLEDVEAKFKGSSVPAPGQVFWYPLGPGPKDNMVPVRVNAVNEEFLELDGNDHIEGGDMVVEIELVALQK